MVWLGTSCRQRAGPDCLAAWLGKTLIEGVGNYLIAGSFRCEAAWWWGWSRGGPRVGRGRLGLPVFVLPEGPQRSPGSGPACRAVALAMRSSLDAGGAGPEARAAGPAGRAAEA